MCILLLSFCPYMNPVNRVKLFTLSLVKQCQPGNEEAFSETLMNIKVVKYQRYWAPRPRSYSRYMEELASGLKPLWPRRLWTSHCAELLLGFCARFCFLGFRCATWFILHFCMGGTWDWDLNTSSLRSSLLSCIRFWGLCKVLQFHSTCNCLHLHHHCC